MNTDRRGPTSAQLRGDISSGRTGDKVAAIDPAAVPLGTDDEAAGTPPSREAIAMARKAERSGDPGTSDASRAGGEGGWSAVVIWIGAVAVGVAISVIGFFVSG